MSIDTGFITGTGFYSLPNLENVSTQSVRTPYGDVAAEIAIFAGQEVAFIARHGKRHTTAPGEINFQANIYAMKQLGVRRILATSVSGSLVTEWAPGSLVLIDQFLNFTYGRKETFYPLNGRLAHIDVTHPYCPSLQEYICQSAQKYGITLQTGGVYACTNGPRFETMAEIEMMRRLGANLVGQTNYPECVLARELAICYATIGVVSNYAAGMSDRVTAKEVTQNLHGMGEIISNLFSDVLLAHPIVPDCLCQHALDEADLL